MEEPSRKADSSGTSRRLSAVLMSTIKEMEERLRWLRKEGSSDPAVQLSPLILQFSSAFRQSDVKSERQQTALALHHSLPGLNQAARRVNTHSPGAVAHQFLKCSVTFPSVCHKHPEICLNIKSGF